MARTEHITLDELEPVEGEWEAGRQATELVGLDELEEVDLEPLDPKDANAAPALPDVGMRAHAPTPPLPVMRPAPKAKKKASTPPPPPKPPTRAESLKEAPKPMIGGEGWEPQGPISIVDFSAVLTAPRRRSEPPAEGEMVPGFSPSSPLLPSTIRPREPSSGWSAARALLLTLVVVGVGVGAYLLGRQEVLGGTEIAEAESPEERGAADAEAPAPTPEAELGQASEDDGESEPNAASEAPAEPAAAAMTETPTAAVMEPTRREAAPTRMAVAPTQRAAMSSATTSAARTERPTTMSAAAPEGEPSPEPTPMTASEPSPMTAATMTARAVEQEAAPSDLPASPSREQVQAALDGVRPQVAACLEGQHATVRVRVTVRGSGRVTTAQVEDSTWARPPHGSCIARAVRHARFPQFADESFVVLYPFQI